jgi:hypothetical protein
MLGNMIRKGRKLYMERTRNKEILGKFQGMSKG